MASLKVGDGGPEVELAQAALNYHIGKGKKITVDGKFGWETHNRVVNFQTFHGLVPDGKIGDRTREKLFQVKTYLISGSILTRPSEVRQAAAPRFPNMPMNPFPQPTVDWSKINWQQLPLWPKPPVPSTPWPNLTLTFPPFPGLPGLPAPPPPPRLVLSSNIPPGGSVSAPPAFTPLNTPTADIFMIKASVLSREKNLKVSGSVEPMLDDDGRTYKLQGLVKAQVEMLDIFNMKVSYYVAAEAEAGLTPPSGKVVGSTGLKFSFMRGVLDLSTDFKFLKIDSEKGEVKAGANALMVKAAIMW